MNEISIALISFILRTFFSILVLFKLNQPLYIKILLLIFLDGLDCNFFINEILSSNFKWNTENIFKILKKNSRECKYNVLYQKMDKVFDKIIYLILLYYVYKISYFSNNELLIFIFLIIYRIIGTVLYLKTNNRRYLFYFPNFYLELMLVFSLIKEFNLSKKIKIIGIISLFIYKIVQEYVIHYNH